MGAERLLPIEWAHLSGISYKTIGEAGLEFLEDIKEADFSVKTTTNPCGMDLLRWKELGIDESFAIKQLRILNCLERMGASLTLTCTPYHLEMPKFGQHLAWAESSAVCFVNSVIGARTNREGALSALASAITGFTPDCGVHREENRAPDVLVKVGVELNSVTDFGVLGYVVGEIVGDSVPYFVGIRGGIDQLKAIGAGLATGGAVVMFHVQDVTPESKKYDIRGLEKIEVDHRDIQKVYEKWGGEGGDAIFLGCPHLSKEELQRSFKSKKPVFACVARLLACRERGSVRILCDTCPVVAPFRFDKIVVDSVKAAAYLGERAILRRREEILEGKGY